MPSNVAETQAPPPPPFLDVPALLELSRPQPRVNWVGFVGMGCLALATYTAVAALRPSGSGGGAQPVVDALLLGMTALAIGGFVMAVRKHRRQFQTVESIEEMVQLRRWEPAGILLDRFLAAPVRSPRVWARALVQLAAVLARHHRFADAVQVDDFLIEHEGLLDDGAAYGVRAMRAMALLREDALLDADRAISDLRRRGPARESGPLALIEIYRDVKTGHPAEAIEVFDARRDVIRQHLGHRAADAHALVARAYDLLGRDAEAAAAYARATALAPAAELHRRYPELAPLVGKYPPTPAPQEVA
jgi:tetratricopeptide (TPR) repeat protein